MSVLGDYCAISGQKVNHQKNCYLVSPNLSLLRRILIGQVTGFQQKSFPTKYLGCPLFIGRRKKVYFAEICSAVANRILSWKHRILLPGDRITLIKSVLSSIPVHILVVASPPLRVLRELKNFMAAFL